MLTQDKIDNHEQLLYTLYQNYYERDLTPEQHLSSFWKQMHKESKVEVDDKKITNLSGIGFGNLFADTIFRKIQNNMTTILYLLRLNNRIEILKLYRRVRPIVKRMGFYFSYDCLRFMCTLALFAKNFRPKDEIRFEKFKHIIENIIRKEYTSAMQEELCKSFSNLVYKKIIQCPFVDGAKDLLEDFEGNISMYISSINPSDELSAVMKERGLSKYFKKVYAHPWSKKEAIEDILIRERIEPTQAVFIGDSYEDYEAASAKQVFFIGRDSGKSFRGADIPIFRDIHEIRKFLKEKILLGISS